MSEAGPPSTIYSKSCQITLVIRLVSIVNIGMIHVLSSMNFSWVLSRGSCLNMRPLGCVQTLSDEPKTNAPNVST